MESKSNREDNHNLNMREDGGDAIEVLDTETTRVDITSPQERASSTDRSATAKAIMSAAPSTSGPPLDQDILTLNSFIPIQITQSKCIVKMFIPIVVL
jgi:hypothetical protein